MSIVVVHIVSFFLHSVYSVIVLP